MGPEKLAKIAVAALEDIKARDIVVFNVKKMTALFDKVIIASGDSNRQVRALANNANLTLHVIVEAGTNAHHIVEAVFKSLARALRAAVSIDPDQHGVPSTKGTLTD
mgnify:CR=1 FL=1